MILTKENFFDHMTPEPNTGCWLWTGNHNHTGHGQYYDSLKRKPTFVHRTSYEIHIGPIPEKLSVLHKCDVGVCINPDHLWLGTQLDNMRDMVKKKRKIEQKRTHCPRGHILGGDNLLKSKLPKRECKECAYESNRKRNKKRGHIYRKNKALKKQRLKQGAIY